MTTLGSTHGNVTHPVSAEARALAARLSALFESDVQIVTRLNAAQRRLAGANERLWSGLAPDAFGLIYDGAALAGHSPIAELLDTTPGGEPGSRAAVLQALQAVCWQVHRGFREYQSACEERRQLAFEVGELSVKLTEALCAVGWTEDDAQSADVHQIAAAAESITRLEGPGR